MREFNVPQFIDVEDRIVGPITVRQFLTMMGGGVVVVALYRLVPFNFFLGLGGLIVLVTTAFAFVRINGQPLHLFLVNITQTINRPRLRIWKKEVEEIRLPAGKEGHIMESPPRRVLLTPSRISELVLMVNTGGIYQGEEGEK